MTRARRLGAVVGATLSIGFVAQGAAQDPVVDSLLTRVAGLRSPALSPDGRLIAFARVAADSEASPGAIWVVETSGGDPRQIGIGGDPAWSPDGRSIAYRTADGSIAISSIGVSTEGTVLPDSRDARSFRWSPDGRFIGFTRPRRDGPDTTRPRLGTGRTARPHHLFIVPVAGGPARQVSPDSLEIGAQDGGVPGTIPFDWAGNATLVFSASAAGARAGRASALFTLEAGSGVVRRLTSHPGLWHSPVVSPDGRSVAYLGHPETSASYRSQVITVMRVDGAVPRVVASSLDRDPLSLHWSDGQTVWFHAQDRGTVNTFVVNVRTGRVQPGSNGAHRLTLGSVNGRARVGVAVRSTPDLPDELYRFPLGKPEQLTQVTRLHDALAAGLPRGETEEVEFRSRDGTLVHGWLTRPPQFDPARRWPLVVMLHDGPHAMADAGFDRSVIRMAALGSLVLRLNPRGSTGYGTDFGNRLATFPSADVDDVLEGIADVVRQGMVDTSRVALRGCGSGAATMLAALIRSSFSAAVAECPARFLSPGLDGSALVFARPFRADLIDWLAASPLRDVGRVRTPVLFVVRNDEPRSAEDQRAAWHQELRLRGVPVAWADIGADDDWLAVERTVAWWVGGGR